MSQPNSAGVAKKLTGPEEQPYWGSHPEFGHALMTRLSTIPYLQGQSIAEYLQQCKIDHPWLFDLLDPSRFCGDYLHRLVNELNSASPHFESEQQGGRGTSYRKAQNRNPLLRATGVSALFELVAPKGRSFQAPEVILDIIGGNGSLTRAVRSLERPEQAPLIVTSDVSEMMIADAWAQSLPAIRQPAQHLLFRDACVDGVILAYGTHHIRPESRSIVLQEAHRVLKGGCRVVVQDFEEGSPTARWYSELLDCYTVTGHKFQHFTREHLLDLVTDAGFLDVQLLDVYDPFLWYGREPETARKELVEHLCELFGLEKLTLALRRSPDHWKEIERLFSPYGTFLENRSAAAPPAKLKPSVTQLGDGAYIVEFPRFALVAVGTKAHQDGLHSAAHD